MLGKIVNGKLTYPSHRIILNGMQIFNPTAEHLMQAGYKEITEVEMPDDAPEGQHYEAQYTDGVDAIVQSWVLVDDVEIPESETVEQRVSKLEQDVSGITTAIERGLTE